MAISRQAGHGKAIELKGRMSSLTVLRALATTVSDVLAGLDGRMAEAPAMFRGMPVALEAEADSDWPDDAWRDLIEGLRNRGLAPVAMTGEAVEALAARLGLGVLPNTGEAASPRREAADESDTAVLAGRVLDQAVRSGQQVYARGGDLVIAATVSPGAEVMADGHVHVYGALKGRAMAGVRGDGSARILCRRFDAELVAIAGHYQVSGNISDFYRGSEVCICLRDEGLSIESLSGVG